MVMERGEASMIIAVASGKGGTGKTTVATNLARSLSNGVQFIDCDVEEPNSHLFLNPRIEKSRDVDVPCPEVDLDKCTCCGECATICRFSAIAVVKDNVLVFPELCHGCGGCSKACPENAIREVPRAIGVLEQGTADPLRFVHGRLKIGEAMSPPLIKAARGLAAGNGIVIIDAPPGTSCPVITAIKGSDFCLLVTEPTPFGLNDLKLTVEVVRELGMPSGVVINRSDIGDRETKAFCESEGIPVLMEIPEDRRIAEAYSRGEMIIDVLPDYREKFRQLFEVIRDRITGKDG
jgi:MinD superfamily P-loop ATPase